MITIGHVSIYTYMYAVLTQINAFFFPLNILLVMLLFFCNTFAKDQVVSLLVCWLASRKNTKLLNRRTRMSPGSE